jgi:hypothetical protein
VEMLKAKGIEAINLKGGIIAYRKYEEKLNKKTSN